MNFRTRLSLIIGAGSMYGCANTAYDNLLPVKATGLYHMSLGARVSNKSFYLLCINKTVNGKIMLGSHTRPFLGNIVKEGKT